MKSQLSDFALLGGSPAFAEKLHVGRPNIPNRSRLLARINDLLDRKWLSNNGPFVQEFEAAIAKHIGVRHCVAVCNGTVALEIASRAMALTGEVIVPSFTFVATAHALQWQEITPVFCDVDRQTHNLDPSAVERMITPRTSGIVGVHLWGRPCNIDALTEIAQRHHLRLMFDASHAFNSSYNGTKVGNFGDVEVFSFHATKFLNTFEGGAIVTNNDKLASKMRLMKNFGFAGYDDVIYIGTNGKMSEVCAAMGLTGLEEVEDVIARNKNNYWHYQCLLASLPGLNIIKYNEQENGNYQYLVVEVNEKEAGLSRDELMRLLWSENILARRYFYPGCHRMQPYKSLFPHAGLLLQNTEDICKQVLLLPTGPSITDNDIDKVCGVIKIGLSNAPDLKGALNCQKK